MKSYQMHGLKSSRRTQHLPYIEFSPEACPLSIAKLQTAAVNCTTVTVNASFAELQGKLRREIARTSCVPLKKSSVDQVSISRRKVWPVHVSARHHSMLGSHWAGSCIQKACKHLEQP